MSVHIIYYKGGVKMMRPIQSRKEYMDLRRSAWQKSVMKSIARGSESQKTKLIQMNYSCLPNEDGSLKGAKTMSTTVGMDIDHIEPEKMEEVKNRILSKKDELGLLMLELSARKKGYHLVFRRRPELSQEDNLRWASSLLDVAYDEGAKDITRVFFTTTEEELVFLDDEIFRNSGISGNSGKSESSENSEYSENSESSEKALPSPSGEGSGVRLYHGIPYSQIVDAWLEGKKVKEGDRHRTSLYLADHLRYITDNDAALIERILRETPFVQEIVQERGENVAQTVKSAQGYTFYKNIPKKMRDALVRVGVNLEDTEDAIPLEEDGEAYSPKPEVPSQLATGTLPIGLKESLVGVPPSMFMPVLCSIMPLAAAYADGVEVRYCDGELQKLGMMSIIYGEQASGKSVCKHAVNIWKRQFDEEDALARKREDEWKERKKGRKANEKAPEDPKVLIRVVPVTVSCSTLLKRLKNAGGHTLYSFGEELDTLRKTNGAGSWSSKYDIYRLAFDPLDSEWGQDYNSDQAESGVVKVAYNWTVLGTNGAVRKCFKSDNIENGLSSRILLAEMPDTAFAQMPRYGRRTADDEARIQEAIGQLRGFSGFLDTPRLRDAIDQWVEEKRIEAAKDIDHVKDTYRRRAAVIGFRCGVIHHLLSGQQEESNASIEFALMMAEYCMSQQIKVFGKMLQSQYMDASEDFPHYGANNSIFDQLPPTFTANDLAALKPSFVPRNSIIKILSRWNRDGWIEKVDGRHWTKKVTK